MINKLLIVIALALCLCLAVPTMAHTCDEWGSGYITRNVTIADTDAGDLFSPYYMWDENDVRYEIGSGFDPTPEWGIAKSLRSARVTLTIIKVPEGSHNRLKVIKIVPLCEFGCTCTNPCCKNA